MEIALFVSELHKFILLHGLRLELVEGEYMFAEQEAATSVYMVLEGQFAGKNTNGLIIKAVTNDIVGIKEIWHNDAALTPMVCISPRARVCAIDKDLLLSFVIKHRSAAIKWMFSAQGKATASPIVYYE